MEMKVSLSESVTQSEAYKRKFSLWELYRSFVYAPRAARKLMKNRKTKLVDPHFVERLQLAVTEVNGCAACSYQHTKMALAQGMSNEEISSFLSGGNDFIKPEEAKAIVFAQHFADSRGFPKQYAYDAIVEEYGKEKAQIILAAAQTMIAGNIYGIPLSALLSRLQGKPYKNSNLFYELSMEIIGLFLLPIGILDGLVRAIVRLPNERFDKSTTEK
jgi:AhpD family alkylhydroperoxidase